MATNLDSWPKSSEEGLGSVLQFVWRCLHEWSSSYRNIHWKLILVLISIFLGEKIVWDFILNKFTYWFNPIFLFNNSELKWYDYCIYSEVNSFAKNFLKIKNWKKFHVNHIPILHIWEPKTKPYILKELLIKMSTNSSYFFFISFCELQTI